MPKGKPFNRATAYLRSKAPQAGMFSTLDDLIQAAPFERAPLEQWKAYLKAGQSLSREGVSFPLRQEEIDYSGLGKLAPGDTPWEKDTLREAISSSRPEFSLVVGEKPQLGVPGPVDEEAAILRADPESRVRAQWESPQYENYGLQLKSPFYSESRTNLKGLRHPESHFSPDALSWSRVTRHPGPEGDDPIRLLEEIQSDVHQHAADKIQAPWTEGDLVQGRRMIAEREATRRAVEEGMITQEEGRAKFAALDAEGQAASAAREARIVRRGYRDAAAIENVKRQLQESRDNRGVGSLSLKTAPDTNEELSLRAQWAQLERAPPDAPFKDPADYGRLELRKQLLNAVREGDTYLGLIPGEELAKRFHHTGENAKGMAYTYDKVYNSELKKLARQYGAKIVDVPLSMAAKQRLRSETLEMHEWENIEDAWDGLADRVDETELAESGDDPLEAWRDVLRTTEDLITDVKSQMREHGITQHEALTQIPTLWRRLTKTLDSVDRWTDDLDGRLTSSWGKLMGYLRFGEQSLLEAMGGWVSSVSTIKAMKITPEVAKRVKKAGVPLFSAAGATLGLPDRVEELEERAEMAKGGPLFKAAMDRSQGWRKKWKQLPTLDDLNLTEDERKEVLRWMNTGDWPYQENITRGSKAQKIFDKLTSRYRLPKGLQLWRGIGRDYGVNSGYSAFTLNPSLAKQYADNAAADNEDISNLLGYLVQKDRGLILRPEKELIDWSRDLFIDDQGEILFPRKQRLKVKGEEPLGRTRVYTELKKAKGGRVSRFGLSSPPSRYSGHRGPPDVEWDSQDLQDSVERPNADSIRKDYGGPDDTVYQSYVPIEDTPHPVLAEEGNVVQEGDEDVIGYDWSELQRGRGSPPPVKIYVDKNGRAEILDGNHRVKFWEGRGYTHVPAWIIDARKNVETDDLEEYAEGGKVDDDGSSALADLKRRAEKSSQVLKDMGIYNSSIFNPSGRTPERAAFKAADRAKRVGSTLASQWMGMSPEGRAEFGHKPGIIDETVALPAWLEGPFNEMRQFIHPGIPDAKAPDWSQEAADRSIALLDDIRRQLDIGQPLGVVDNFAEGAGYMLGQVPIPAGAARAIPKIPKVTGALEFFSPTVEPNPQSYGIGTVFGGTMGAVSGIDEERMADRIQELIERARADEEKARLELEEIYESQGVPPPEYAKGGKIGRRGFLKGVGTLAAGAVLGTGKKIARGLPSIEETTLPKVVKAIDPKMIRVHLGDLLGELEGGEDGILWHNVREMAESAPDKEDLLRRVSTWEALEKQFNDQMNNNPIDYDDDIAHQAWLETWGPYFERYGVDVSNYDEQSKLIDESFDYYKMNEPSPEEEGFSKSSPRPHSLDAALDAGKAIMDPLSEELVPNFEPLMELLKTKKLPKVLNTAYEKFQKTKSDDDYYKLQDIVWDLVDQIDEDIEMAKGGRIRRALEELEEDAATPILSPDAGRKVRSFKSDVDAKLWRAARARPSDFVLLPPSRGELKMMYIGSDPNYNILAEDPESGLPIARAKGGKPQRRK